MAIGKKTGGRKAGTPNKDTAKTKAFLSTIVEQNHTKLTNELESLTGKPYIDAMLSIMDFVVPKLQRVDLTPNVEVEFKSIEPINWVD